MQPTTVTSSKHRPKKSLRTFVQRLFSHGCSPLQASLDIIGVLMQIRAVIHVTQGVEDLGVDSVLDAVDRSVAEQGIDPGGMGRTKDPPGVEVAILNVLILGRISEP